MKNNEQSKIQTQKKHIEEFILGSFAKVTNSTSPFYGKVGRVIDINIGLEDFLDYISISFDNKNVYEFDPSCLTPCPKPKFRGFEQISAIKTTIPLPVRKTRASAGYDIGVIHPKVYELICQGCTIDEAWDKIPKVNGSAIVTRDSEASIILPTGIKAYMQNDEVLVMAVRSSSGIKKAIRQSNPPSWIDADYYNNQDNEGHIKFAVSNDMIVFDKPIMEIAQGIFINYLIADTGNEEYERIGGIGSTN